MAEWRDDDQAIVFKPAGHVGLCFVHRLAIRTLLGHLPDGPECLGYFDTRTAAFETAAQAKIGLRGLERDANFHLTSRDIAARF